MLRPIARPASLRFRGIVQLKNFHALRFGNLSFTTVARDPATLFINLKSIRWLLIDNVKGINSNFSISETPIPKAKCIGIGKLMRPKLQKQSALKLAGRIIPQGGGYDTPQIAAKSLPKACFGVHTRG